MDYIRSCLSYLYQYCFDYHCRYCTLIYPKKWYNTENKQCFFCFHFHSVYHTKAYMLKKINWYYEAIPKNNKLAFYEEYMDLLRDWCNHYGIETTIESIELERLIEEEIMSLKYPNT